MQPAVRFFIAPSSELDLGWTWAGLGIGEKEGQQGFGGRNDGQLEDRHGRQLLVHRWRWRSCLRARRRSRVSTPTPDRGDGGKLLNPSSIARCRIPRFRDEAGESQRLSFQHCSLPHTRVLLQDCKPLDFGEAGPRTSSSPKTGEVGSRRRRGNSGDRQPLSGQHSSQLRSDYMPKSTGTSLSECLHQIPSTRSIDHAYGTQRV